MEQIFEYISVNLNNPSAALDQINDFEKAFDNFCAFPGSCPLVNNELSVLSFIILLSTFRITRHPSI